MATARLTRTRPTVPNTELMVVPSLRDVHHDKIFPQPPLEMPEDEVGEGIALYLATHLGLAVSTPRPSLVECRRCTVSPTRSHSP